jgi:serine/threonine protein phosphatase PrpC
MAKETKYVFSSFKGLKHKENWDELLIIDEAEYSIFAVFDGVSSAQGGKKGSLKSKQFIRQNYKKYLTDKFELKNLIYDLNQHLINSNVTEPYSTYCMVYFNKINKSYCYSWLGDSRLYYITNQYVKQLTQDDSYSENSISKFLGDASLDLTDFRELQNFKDSGHLLLCTDGFYKIFESNKLAFFDNFLKKSLPLIKERINSMVRGKNYDDSTFIFVK